mgnify:CR=1 FL=1
MKALLALQHMPARSANILRDTLSDSSDDLRLLAYGMLDSREKQLTHRIQNALQRHADLTTPEERYLPARELAELYWELVYQNLVQGDMRQFALEQVQRYSNEALKHKVKDAGLWAPHVDVTWRLYSGNGWLYYGDQTRLSVDSC